MANAFKNPFTPGAGHQPPYLAGRDKETKEFVRLLGQDTILENMVLTGLRGTGKTVLLESFKPIAIKEDWKWAGTEISESATISENNLVRRLITDLAFVTSSIVVKTQERHHAGFVRNTDKTEVTLNNKLLDAIYEDTPGLVSDKLKNVLEFSWKVLSFAKTRGLIFAYDEAQNLSDQAEKDQYPLSVLLDVFQSLQRKGLPIMLILTGLPTLFPKLVKARTYSERMFHIIEIGRLPKEASRDAVLRPISKANCPVNLTGPSVETIVNLSGGYPYFIQFICREVYDAVLQGAGSVPVDEIVRKLDSDFFMARWSRATDRQRELLTLIAQLENSEGEFSVKDIADISLTKKIDRPFSSPNIYQMLGTLSDIGLVFKNRYGKYSFAVPLMAQFIKREVGRDDDIFS